MVSKKIIHIAFWITNQNQPHSLEIDHIYLPGSYTESPIPDGTSTSIQIGGDISSLKFPMPEPLGSKLLGKVDKIPLTRKNLLSLILEKFIEQLFHGLGHPSWDSKNQRNVGRHASLPLW